MEEAQNIYSLRYTDKHSDTEIFLKKLSERNQYLEISSKFCRNLAKPLMIKLENCYKNPSFYIFCLHFSSLNNFYKFSKSKKVRMGSNLGNSGEKISLAWKKQIK